MAWPPKLESDADAFQSVQSGRAPLAFVVLAAAANHHAAAIAAADAECTLFHGGQNHHALSLVEQILGNVVGDIQNFFQDDAGIFDAVLLRARRWRECGHARHQENQQTHDEFLHESLQRDFKEKTVRFVSLC